MNLYALQGCGETLQNFGDEALKARFVPGIASGETTCCMSLSEADAGSALGSVRDARRARGRGEGPLAPPRHQGLLDERRRRPAARARAQRGRHERRAGPLVVRRPSVAAGRREQARGEARHAREPHGPREPRRRRRLPRRRASARADDVRHVADPRRAPRGRGAGRGDRAGRPRRDRALRPRAQAVRAGHRRLRPGPPAGARDGAAHPGGAQPRLRRGRGRRPHPRAHADARGAPRRPAGRRVARRAPRPRRDRGRAHAAHEVRGHRVGQRSLLPRAPAPRRLRLLPRVRRRAPLPRRARHEPVRGDERDPGRGHRRPARRRQPRRRRARGPPRARRGSRRRRPPEPALDAGIVATREACASLAARAADKALLSSSAPARSPT